ncbi:MAG: hypothetical protein M3T56_18085 [Chloroflexota bacterium]|nr:hypothetical protein [Chloroflexota bacterium]
MPDRFVTRQFVGRREPARSAQAARIPPGQHLTVILRIVQTPKRTHVEVRGKRKSPPPAKT